MLHCVFDHHPIYEFNMLPPTEKESVPEMLKNLLEKQEKIYGLRHRFIVITDGTLKSVKIFMQTIILWFLFFKKKIHI